MWLRELGFHITIAQLEQKTLFQNQQSRDYTIAFSGWSADIPDPVTFWDHGDGRRNNWAGWSNHDFDHLIDEAANEADNARRYEYFQKAEAILLNDARSFPFITSIQTYAINPAVRGWETNLLDFRQFEKVWLEK